MRYYLIKKDNKMSKASKRLVEAKAKVDNVKAYSVAEAVKLIKETSKVKFDASVEMHFHLGIDPKKGEQVVRGSVVMPNGIGKTKRIAVFTTPAHEKEAKEAGADIVGGKELIESIKKDGKCDFDIAIAVPEIMKDLSAIAKTLGQKGLMPNPKTGTVTGDVKGAVAEIKKGKIDFKNDDTANVHAMVGKVSFDEAKLEQNIRALLDAVKRVKPDSIKGTFIESCYLNSTMGPGIKIQL